MKGVGPHHGDESRAAIDATGAGMQKEFIAVMPQDQDSSL
jgi:hypothetical protein